MCKERSHNIVRDSSSNVAEVLNFGKMTKNLKEPTEVPPSRLFTCLHAFLFFLVLISMFSSWQVEIEQKRSLKPDFEGDEMENPRECGVQ